MFFVGQKVVCVKLGEWTDIFPDERGPVHGDVCTIREIECDEEDIFCRLFEFRNPPTCCPYADREHPEECWFDARQFRPLDERKTDISVFLEILRNVPAKRERSPGRRLPVSAARSNLRPVDDEPPAVPHLSDVRFNIGQPNVGHGHLSDDLGKLFYLLLHSGHILLHVRNGVPQREKHADAACKYRHDFDNIADCDCLLNHQVNRRFAGHGLITIPNGSVSLLEKR